MVLETESKSRVETRPKAEPTRISNFGDISFVSQAKIDDPLEELERRDDLNIEQLIEAIIFWGHNQFGVEEFVDAHNEFQALTGRVFYDDYFYHQRVSYFLHFFLFERPISQMANGITPYHAFVNSSYFTCELTNSLNKQKIVDLQENYHSLFYVSRIHKEKLLVRDLFDKKKLTIVRENNTFYGFQTGMVIQGFIFKKISDLYTLSSGILLHPKTVAGIIKKSIKLQQNEQNENKRKILAHFARQNLNLLRRRNMDAKKVYLAK